MNLLQDLTLDAFVSRLIAMLIFSGVLGGLLALLARLMGDRRPQYSGRLTANPFAHVAVPGALLAAIFGIGWIRIIRFDASQNRWGKAGVMVVALAGLALALATVPLVDLLRQIAVNTLPPTAGYAVIQTMIQYQQVAVATVVLNLLPLPGLVCGAIWPAFRPDREKRIMRQEPILLGILAAAIVAGFVGNPAPKLLPYLSSLA